MSCYYKRYSLFISVIRMQNPVSQIVSILLSLSLTQLIFISINVIFSISQNIRDKAEDIFRISTGYKLKGELAFLLGNLFFHELPRDQIRFLRAVNERLDQLKPKLWTNDAIGWENENFDMSQCQCRSKNKIGRGIFVVTWFASIFTVFWYFCFGKIFNKST